VGKQGGACVVKSVSQNARDVPQNARDVPQNARDVL